MCMGSPEQVMRHTKGWPWAAKLAAVSDVLQLVFIHPKIVIQLVDHGLSDLVANLGFVGTHGLDITPVECAAGG